MAAGRSLRGRTPRLTCRGGSGSNGSRKAYMPPRSGAAPGSARSLRGVPSRCPEGLLGRDDAIALRVAVLPRLQAVGESSEVSRQGVGDELSLAALVPHADDLSGPAPFSRRRINALGIPAAVAGDRDPGTTPPVGANAGRRLARPAGELAAIDQALPTLPPRADLLQRERAERHLIPPARVGTGEQARIVRA